MNKSEKIRLLAGLLIIGGMVFFVSACAKIPPKAVAVQNFQKEKYLGTWYEIARFDFRFEKNLDNTKAEYSANPDGTIKVVNSGYDYVKNVNKTATGKAKFTGPENVGQLKVSFFGPFYSGYNVIAVDDDYKYALVAGESLKYLWILSREKSIPEDVKTKYLELAKTVGYDTSELIWVKHDQG